MLVILTLKDIDKRIATNWKPTGLHLKKKKEREREACIQKERKACVALLQFRFEPLQTGLLSWNLPEESTVACVCSLVVFFTWGLHSVEAL